MCLIFQEGIKLIQKKNNKTILYFLKNIFNGILIGVANVIPGLSGATIALILGIYEKLINAISSINKKSLNNIYKIKLKQVYQDFSLEFLIPIIIGIETIILITLTKNIFYIIFFYRSILKPVLQICLALRPYEYRIHQI